MSDARDDLREAIENAVAHQIPFSLVDHPMMAGFTQRAADAVLAVVRGADADQGIPRYAMLDVWMALGGDSQVFDVWMAELRRSPADAWAQLLAAVKGDVVGLCSDTNPPAGELLDLLGVDADQWEQVGVLAKDGRLHGTKNLWDGDEPVYRRVVPVVPSPEPEPSEFDAVLRLERLRQGLCEHGRRMVDDCLYCIRPAVASPELEPLRCESCGELADVRLDDGSTWCVSCDGSARNLGYDEHPVKTWIDRPAVASPDRCLTCRSDDRAVRLVVWGEPSYPDGVPEPYDCDNPWHRVPSTEPRRATDG